MTTQTFLLSAWSWNPWVLVPLAAAGAAYGLRVRAGAGKALSFYSGLAAVALALVSPLGALTMVLFSAHMVQHIVLLLVAPPLLLSGFDLRKGGRTRSRWVGKILGRPGWTWLAGVGGMWLWHMPSLCDAAMAHTWVEVLQDLSLLLFGTMFWWPVVGPRLEERVAPLGGVLYLFTACVGCSLLGIFITFAPVGLYPCFRNPMDPDGMLAMARGWGLGAEADQQIGGLMMWVPCCLVYVTGSLKLLARWYGSKETAGLPAAQGGHHVR